MKNKENKKNESISLDKLKEKYPEIASLSVEDVIGEKLFTEIYDEYIKTLSPRRINPQYYYAFKSLKKDSMLDVSNFKKAFIDCLNKVSNLPFSKRVVIYLIGMKVYNDTIKKLMDIHDNNKN